MLSKKLVIFVIFLVILIAISMLIRLNMQVPRSLRSQEGIEKINKEARQLFDEFFASSKKGEFLYDSELKSYPTIKSLGDSVGIHSSTEQIPAHIRIRYGGHMRAKFIFIFEPGSNPQFNGKDSFIKVGSNIFRSN